MRKAFMHSAKITKYQFRIRTRDGLTVDNLSIHGKDEADAERKLRQMYQHCKIIERSIKNPEKDAELAAAK